MYPKRRSSVSGLERHIKSCLERVTEKENKNKLITWMDGLYFLLIVIQFKVIY